jgi:hypothetical protein
MKRIICFFFFFFFYPDKHVLLHVQRVRHKYFIIAVQFLKYLIVFIFLILVFIADSCSHLYTIQRSRVRKNGF